MRQKPSMAIRNLLPHDVTFKGKTFVSENRFRPARVKERFIPVGTIMDIPLYKSVKYPRVIDLPEPVDGVLFIVNKLILQACPERVDLICPNTSFDFTRDKDGRITNVSSFLTNMEEIIEPSHVIEEQKEMSVGKEEEVKSSAGLSHMEAMIARMLK